MADVLVDRDMVIEKFKISGKWLKKR